MVSYAYNTVSRHYLYLTTSNTILFSRQRMSCEEALAHPWMAAFDSGELETKNLSKEKMKKYLARQKWKVTPNHSTAMFFFEVLFFFSAPDF